MLIIIIAELAFYFYFTHSHLRFFTSLPIPLFNQNQLSPTVTKKIGTVEIESHLDDINIILIKEPLDEILDQWKIWEEGVFITDQKKVLQIKKTPPKKIKIIFSYENYEYDQIFSKEKLISSADRVFMNDTLIIKLGFNKDYIESVDNKNREYLFTQSFLTTLHHVSHFNLDYRETMQELQNILINLKKAGRNIFEVN